MHCFLCSSSVSLESGGRVNVSLTNIFKSLQIERREEAIERICCPKCTQVTNSMTDLIDKMDKIRLELKVKLGQFGLLIKLDTCKENERPDTQPDNHDDESLKAMAKEKCLKIFSDEMQPVINLCTLNSNLLASVTEEHQETNLSTLNADAGGVAMQLADFYAMCDEQQDEAEHLNINNENSQTEPIIEQPLNNSVGPQEVSSTTSREQSPEKRDKEQSPIPSGNPSRSRKRTTRKTVQARKALVIKTGVFHELKNATEKYLQDFLKKQQAVFGSESEQEQSKKNKRKRPVASRDKRKTSVKVSQNSEKRINKRCSSSNESLNEPSGSKIAKVQKRKKLVIYSDDEDEPTREPEVVEISSSDDDADGDNSIQAVVKVDNSDSEDAPTPKIIEIRGSAVQEPAPAILEVSSSASQEPTPEESQDWLNDMFEATEVFPGYSNPTKQESEN